jgi:ribulose-phosphate 3-epimerase
MSIRIAPSLAAGNLLRLEEEIRRLEGSTADMIHLDMMDGHFVPHLTIGVPIVEHVRRATTMHLDVHIMVTNPDAVFDDYLEAGADTLTFHIEAAKHAHRICQKIRSAGKRSGIALNPATHWHDVRFLLPVIDQVTLMTVNPGFSRQAHLDEVHPKLAELSQYCRQHFPNIEIQIDGGVAVANAGRLAQLGATNLVAGGAVMGKPDYHIAVTELRRAGELKN